jgi:hypothetical protein
LDEESEVTKMKKMILIVMAVLLIAVSVSRADYEPYCWDRWRLTEDEFAKCMEFFGTRPYGGLELGWNHWITWIVSFQGDDSAWFQIVYVVKIEATDTIWLYIGLYDGSYVKNLGSKKEERVDIFELRKFWKRINWLFAQKVKEDIGERQEVKK